MIKRIITLFVIAWGSTLPAVYTTGEDSVAWTVVAIVAFLGGCWVLWQYCGQDPGSLPPPR